MPNRRGALSDVQLASFASACHFAIAVPVALFVLRRVYPIRAVVWVFALLAGGMVAAAATSATVALARSAASALERGMRGHAIATVVTFMICACIAVQKPSRGYGGSHYWAIREEATPLLWPQLLAGVASVLLFRALTGGVRGARATAAPPVGVPGRLEALQAFFAVIWYLFAYGLVNDLGWIVRKHAGSIEGLSRLLVAIIPVFTGALAAAVTARSVAGSRIGSALRIGVLAHGLAATAACVGLGAATIFDEILRGYGVASAVQRFLYFSGLGLVLLPHAITQTVLGTIACLAFWLTTRALPAEMRRLIP